MENLQEINSKYALIAELKLYLEATATGENQKAIDDYNAFLAERHAVKEEINAYFAGIC